jgi:hypothetical protein
MFQKQYYSTLVIECPNQTAASDLKSEFQQDNHFVVLRISEKGPYLTATTRHSNKNDSEKKRNEIKEIIAKRTFSDDSGTPKKYKIQEGGRWDRRITDTENKKLLTILSVFATTFASSSLLSTFLEGLTIDTPLAEYGFTFFKAGVISIFPAVVAALTVKETEK